MPLNKVAGQILVNVCLMSAYKWLWQDMKNINTVFQRITAVSYASTLSHTYLQIHLVDNSRNVGQQAKNFQASYA